MIIDFYPLILKSNEIPLINFGINFMAYKIKTIETNDVMSLFACFFFFWNGKKHQR